MWFSHILFPSFALLVAGGSVHQLPGEEGDFCQAPEGVGTCQTTSNCAGIAYPDDYCPKDPVNVQCCVPKKCSAPYTNSLFRHTNQGCSGGSFVKDHCPGDAYIQCCAKSAGADPESCRNPEENKCTFYPNCLEERLKCGPDGYPIGYGLKYCNKFTAARPQFSAAGKQWVTTTMLCLQRSLVPWAVGEKSGTCAALKDFAFDTHPGCYVSSGFCTLPPTDWETVIATVSLKELFGSLESLKATLEAGKDCVEFYEWLIKRDIITIVDKIEDSAQSIWNKVSSWF